MNPFISRRTLLKTTSAGFGYLAFAGLSTWAAEKAKSPLAPKQPHFEPKAKRVIFMCMDGAPSHVDTFDYKPKLNTDDGKAFGKGRLFNAKLLGSPWKFSQHGKSGLWISELFPNVAKCADDLCLLRGMHTDVPAHPQAFVQMHTGLSQFPRPSMGAWTLYGLGTENESLPGFITLCPAANNGGPANYGSSFLPAIYQGTRIGFAGRPVTDAKAGNIANPNQSHDAQRVQLDFLKSLNQNTLERDTVSPGVEGMIESYELAFRMQGALPALMDISNETKATREQYGIDDTATDNFGRQCLLARRFAEAGVRFIEVSLGGWDHHRNLKADLPKNCTAVDKPIAGLLSDLKSRGMLKDTLVIWGGEFGRTPTAQNGDGRDHNNKGYTMWMAGAGLKAGFSYGQTDEYGAEAIDGKIHIHDWHATILHLLGLDHEKLTYRHAGRDMRLTDVKGKVVKEIIA
jgi:hypothetical protein